MAYMCCLQGCAEKTTKQESPCRASRVVSPSGEEGAAESISASPAGSESFPVNPPSMLPPHNAWGGSNAGLDMEAFGPSGTVVFRNHAFPSTGEPLPMTAPNRAKGKQVKPIIKSELTEQ